MNFLEKKTQKNKTVKPWQIVGEKYMKELNDFFLQLNYLDIDVNNIN